MRISASRPVESALYVRIPAWATPAPILSVNGKRVIDPVEPGTFAAVRRTWQDGDRIELELPMPLRLEPVDAQHSNQVALLRGPLVLFAVAASQPAFEKAELLRAKSATNAPGRVGRYCSRRDERCDAAFHENPGGELHHVPLVEIVTACILRASQN
jgi:DUF1680 family protein